MVKETSELVGWLVGWLDKLDNRVQPLWSLAAKCWVDISCLPTSCKRLEELPSTILIIVIVVDGNVHCLMQLKVIVFFRLWYFFFPLFSLTRLVKWMA